MLFERFGLVGSPDRKKQRRGSAGPNALQSSAAKAGPSPHAINSSGESLDHLPIPSNPFPFSLLNATMSILPSTKIMADLKNVIFI